MKSQTDLLCMTFMMKYVGSGSNMSNRNDCGTIRSHAQQTSYEDCSSALLLFKESEQPLNGLDARCHAHACVGMYVCLFVATVLNLQ